MKYQTIALAIFLSIPLNAQAFSFDENIRPFLERTLGEQRVSSWFGERGESIELPPIPEVHEDSRSVETYEREERPDEYEDDQRRQYNYSFIRELYRVVRNERATRDDEARWMNTLEQGGSREGVYRALVLDNTYAGMENYGPNANEDLIEFVRHFMEKYIGRSVRVDSLEGMNFYTLKRVITEHALGVMGELMLKDDHLPRWYAVFSAEMAREYREIWENEIRGERDSRYHYRWAENVPTQHLKSEMIIKLHKVMNYKMQISR